MNNWEDEYAFVEKREYMYVKNNYEFCFEHSVTDTLIIHSRGDNSIHWPET